MNSKVCKFLCLSVTANCLGAWPALSIVAQETRDAAEEIVVTSSRVPQRLDQVGTTVSVMTAEDMELRQITVLDEVLERIPGVHVTRSGGLGQNTQVRIRGFTTKHVLTMIDGIKVNNAAEFSTQFGIEDTFLGNVERIEVLRGPQSGLYGADAVAGVVNIITRPGEGDPKFRGTVSYGSHDTYELSAGTDGSVGSAAYIAGASYFDTDGISLASRSPGNIEDDAYRNLTLNGRVDVALSENLDVRTWLRYTDARNDTDNGFLPSNNPAGLPAFLFQDSEGHADTQQLFGAVSASLSTLGGDLHHDAQLSYVDIDTTSVAPGSEQQSRGQRVELTYYGTYRFTADSFLLFGADYHNESGRYEQPVGSPFAAVDDSIDNWAGYLTVNVSPFTGLDLSGAVRYDDNELFGGETTYRLTGAFNLPDGFDFVGVDTRFRTSYGTGAEAPSLRQLRGASATFLGNPDLQPESTWMVDVGIEQRLEDGLARWSVTYYNGSANDGIFSVFDPELFVSQPQNVDSPVDMEGVEIEFRATPAYWLDVQLAYTYATSILVDTDTQLFGRPRHQFSGAVTLRPSDAWSITVDGYNRSKFFSDYPSTYEMPGYSLLNLSSSYQMLPNVTVSGRIQNLFDRTYEEKLGDSTYGRTFQLRLSVQY